MSTEDVTVPTIAGVAVIEPQVVNVRRRQIRRIRLDYPLNRLRATTITTSWSTCTLFSQEVDADIGFHVL